MNWIFAHLISSSRNLPSDESALKALIASLTTQKDALGSWFHFWTLLVAIGVAIEVTFVIHEYWDDRQFGKRWSNFWKYRIIIPPDKPSIGWMILELFAATLVGIGVAGEFVIDVQVSGLETQVREANTKLVGILDQKVTEQKADLLRLQQATLPRNFDPKVVAPKLRGMVGMRFATSTLCDFEPARTASLIREALREANALPDGAGASCGTPPDELSRPGVWIAVKTIPETEPGSHTGEVIRHTEKERAEKLSILKRQASTLVRVLNDAGVEAYVREPSNHPTFGQEVLAGGMTIYVSLRPMPGMSDDLRVVSAAK